jgi:hypothetical protein
MGIEVDHVTLFRWVQRFTPLLVEAARPCRHGVGGQWFVGETYVAPGGAARRRETAECLLDRAEHVQTVGDCPVCQVERYRRRSRTRAGRLGGGGIRR